MTKGRTFEQSKNVSKSLSSPGHNEEVRRLHQKLFSTLSSSCVCVTRVKALNSTRSCLGEPQIAGFATRPTFNC